MQRILLLTAAACLFLAGFTSAQHWTPEEQEIIDLNQSCWEAWWAEDLEQMRATCNEHPDGRSWLLTNPAPESGWTHKNQERHLKALGDYVECLYFEINPLSVRIFNDTALIFFSANRTMRDHKDNLSTIQQRHLNIWQKQSGKWTWIGSMIDPKTL